MTKDEIVALIVSYARENGIEPWEFLGGAIAESALNPAARRPREPSQDQAYWPDVSFGLFQQTARWATEGDQSPRADNIRYIEQLYSDPHHAARVAAKKFKGYRSGETSALDAWCRYNWPAKNPAENPNRANYRSGLDEAKRLLSMGGPAPSPTPAPVPPASNLDAILARVVELGKAETGKRYAGPVIGEPDSYRWGDPGWDCSSFVSAMYSRATGGTIKLTPFTDAAHGQCEWLASPKPGAVVFYVYRDSSQPNVRIPHMGIWLSPTEVLDARYPDGVGIHPHVTPIQDGARYRQTMLPKGLASVAPPAPPPQPPADPRDAVIAELQRQLADKDKRLREAVSHLGSVSGDYANGLQFIVDELRALKPPAN